MAAAIGRLRRPFLILFFCIAFASSSIGASIKDSRYSGDIQRPIGKGDQSPTTPLPSAATQEPDILPVLLDALDVLQEDYFAVWQGLWPTSIDWTSAVIGTYLSAALTTLTTSFSLLPTAEQYPSKSNDNRINRYFSQLVASYFGQDAFALRTEAYDDMLWVVLGWLESIKFVNMHSTLHYNVERGQPWYGTQWIPAFSHRARIFWDLASQGWDTILCDGGMIWSPYLAPYKNAVTNELFIAASISMYLYFPGDTNESPFIQSQDGGNEPPGGPTGPRDPKYLAAAVEGYKWLKNSNMTNNQGLYTDGFHISGLPNRPYNNATDGNGNKKCDSRNNMVLTYNQGVLLTGHRGLYEATGARSYLDDGHKLVQDVIAATGYDMKADKAYDDTVAGEAMATDLPKWYGLGRAGILEDACDSGGYCSQDGQTFKGIFFHHFTFFCSQLPPQIIGEMNTYESQLVRDWHDAKCKSYKKWVFRNARGVLSSKDKSGKFGTWWGAPKNTTSLDIQVQLPEGAVDYRNLDMEGDNIWKESGRLGNSRENGGDDMSFTDSSSGHGIGVLDLNDRGRGRTVETQGGGLCVLRAAWEWQGRI